MKDWKGCRGLDPEVAAQVTKAMPPYLIGQEAMSPIPFSATNQTSLKQCMSYEPEFASQHFEAFPDCPSPRNTQKMTCWEILTVRLGRFALEKIMQGITPSDETLQDYARQLLYGNDDPWNQTAADNPEWLNLFKKAHGLLTPSEDTAPAGQDRSTYPACWTPQETEKWGDLGLSVPMTWSDNHPISPVAGTSGLDHPMDGDHDNAFELPSTARGDDEFDFDQIFTMMNENENETVPELERLLEPQGISNADIALDEALIHGLGD